MTPAVRVKEGEWNSLVVCVCERERERESKMESERVKEKEREKRCRKVKRLMVFRNPHWPCEDSFELLVLVNKIFSLTSTEMG